MVNRHLDAVRPVGAVTCAGMIAVVILAALASPLLAHSGGEASGISVEPSQITAGGSVVLAGRGLEPDSDRQINLVGPDVIVPFPTVTTDEDGMFAVTLTIPSHLPSGSYTFQAIGDETLTTTLTVAAAAGQGAQEPANEVAATRRVRSGGALGLIGLLVVICAGLGWLLIWRAERFGGAMRPRSGGTPTVAD